MFAEGIVFSSKELIERWFFNLRIADHDGVGGKVAKSLGTATHETGNSTDQVKRRKHVDEAEQIADRDLAELQFHPLHIDDTQSKDAFADRLAAPIPFRKHAVADL